MFDIRKVEAFYRGRRVLVTGHTGFKGSWLTYWLHELGADVMGVALEARPGELFEQISGDSLCESLILDIRNYAGCLEAIKTFRPQTVIHMAAQSLVGEGYERPRYTFDVNSQGTVNVLEAIRESEQRCDVVIVTTDKVYENLEEGKPFRVGDKLGGHDPYSASKASAEIVVESYRRSFFQPKSFESHGVAVATARAGNVIGGGDWNKGHLVPDIVRALAAREAVRLRNPAAVRPWQHVVEPLSGYLLLGQRLNSDPASYSGAWNFGPDLSANVTVEAFVQLAIDYWSEGTYKTDTTSEKPNEAGILRLDTEATTSGLGWRPAFSLATAVERTLSWYVDAQDREFEARARMSADIDTYRDAVSTLLVGDRF
jgi:CDP-glucose 4,6-dehydratase